MHPNRNTPAPVAARLVKLWVRIFPGAWMSVCCERCVLSGRGLCDGLIPRPEESYRLWCVVVCDLGTSRRRRPWPTGGWGGGCCARKRGEGRGSYALSSKFSNLRLITDTMKIFLLMFYDVDFTIVVFSAVLLEDEIRFREVEFYYKISFILNLICGTNIHGRSKHRSYYISSMDTVLTISILPSIINRYFPNVRNIFKLEHPDVLCSNPVCRILYGTGANSFAGYVNVFLKFVVVRLNRILRPPYRSFPDYSLT
jgi:hypothetical protein